MSGDDSWFEETDDELEEHEFPGDDDESAETIACPACGAEVYEDAIRCPACGTYITQTTKALAALPLWAVILGLLGILAVVLALIGYSVR